MDINYEIDLKDEETDYQYANQEIETVFMYEEHDALNQDGNAVEGSCENNIRKDEEVKTEITNVTKRDSIMEAIDDAIKRTNDDINENIQQINKFNALNTYINDVELVYKEHVTSYTDFIHITSNYNSRIGSSYRIWKTLPRSVLDVRAPNDHKGGVFAVRYIPKGIRLGPIEGLTNTQRDAYYAWRFDNGRLLYTSKLNFSNWPRFVNYASKKADQNLTIFQHNRHLYFRTVKDINVDEELLVRYENIVIENLFGEEYCVPYIEKEFVKAQFCFYCNLGFKDEFSLNSHTCTVPNEISDFEIITCRFCNVFTCERKYIESHVKNCEGSIFFKGVELIKEGKCRFCNTPQDDLRWHIIKKHYIKKKVLQCNICNFLCSNMDDLLAHKKGYCIVKDPSFDKNHTKDIELCDPQKDLKKYTKDGRKKDVDREERFNDRAVKNVRKDVDVPKKVESAEDTSATNKPYCCPFCDFKSKRRYLLKSHLKVRHKIIAYSKQIHTNGMLYVSGLFDVSSSRELMREPVRVKCPVCGVYRHLLKLHIRKQHRQGNQYKCDDCNFTCATVDNLFIHVRTHEEESENERSSNATDDDNTEDVDPLGQDVEKGDPQYSEPMET